MHICVQGTDKKLDWQNIMGTLNKKYDTISESMSI